jgi:hypothetical protein
MTSGIENKKHDTILVYQNMGILQMRRAYSLYKTCDDDLFPSFRG